jgi:hypothetical protein
MRSAETLGPWLRGLQDWVAPPGIRELPAGPHVDSVDDWLRGGGLLQSPLVRARLLHRSGWTLKPAHRASGMMGIRA